MDLLESKSSRDVDRVRMMPHTLVVEARTKVLLEKRCVCTRQLESPATAYDPDEEGRY